MLRLPVFPLKPIPPRTAESASMNTPTPKMLYLAGMSLLTLAAVAVMVFVVQRNDGQSAKTDAQQAKRTVVAVPSAFVSVRQLEPETVEIVDIFTGKIRAWEQYLISFEISGRVKELGTNIAGQMLDEGDSVRAGQVLARLDDRLLLARKNEAAAELERAKTNLDRAKDLRTRGVGGISDIDFLDRSTAEATARATFEMASKNLDDAVITAPVDGVISRRRIKSGESVTAHAPVFEVVQLDPVLLVLDVPESRVREIEQKATAIERNRRARDGVAIDPQDLEFKVRVHIEAQDRFGKDWPSLMGHVHHVAEMADAPTGLFEVEVRVDNPNRVLKPGMVARAELISGRIEAYRIPTTSVIFRRDGASFFTLDEVPVDVNAMFWDLGAGVVHRARKVKLDRYVEQGPDVIVPARGQELGTAVVRGQHRLAHGQVVRIVPTDQREPARLEQEIRLSPGTAVSAKPQ
jgi:RND family efflux transporter MFP subunit